MRAPHSRRFLEAHGGEFVVKPSVGAGSRDAQRYARDESDAALAHVAAPARGETAACCCSRISIASTSTAKPR